MTPDSAQRVHVLRFAAPDTRAALDALWTVADEIHGSACPDLDHTVAHARLAWWQEECARTARGGAAHPLTALLSRRVHEVAGVWPQLAGCVRAAALELAHAPLATHEERRDYADASLGTVFACMAQVLGARNTDSDTARELGTQLALLQLDPDDQDAAHSARVALERLPPSVQPALRPLLVWVALLASQSRTAGPRAMTSTTGSLRHELATTIRAWRAALSAQRGRFHLPL